MASYKITDIKALKDKYPHLVKTVTTDKPDRVKISAALKAGFELPGVIKSDSEEEQAIPPFLKNEA